MQMHQPTTCIQQALPLTEAGTVAEVSNCFNSSSTVFHLRVAHSASQSSTLIGVSSFVQTLGRALTWRMWVCV